MKSFGSVLAWMLLALNMHAQEKALFSVAELKQDLAVFRAALTEAHPGLYVYHDKAYFDARFAAIEKQIKQPMPEEAFYRLLNPLVAAIGCGHTKWHRNGKPDDLFAFHAQGLFPLRLFFRDKKAYVQYAYGENNIPAGAEVTSINGVNMAGVSQQLLGEILEDGVVESSRWRMLGDHFAGYYVSFIGESGQFTVGYRVAKGAVKTARLAAVDAKTIIERDKVPETESIRLSFPADSIALLRIPVFMPAADTPAFEEVLQRSFAQIEAAGTKHLVLDLRDNEGGMDRWGVLLYAWLTGQPFHYYDRLTVVSDQPLSFRQYATLPDGYDQLKAFIKKQGDEYVFTMHPNLGMQSPQAKPYTGKLYVLINGLSFSVTSEFGAVVREQHRGIFIGEESGGTIEGNNSGGFAIVRLPNTHLTLGVPLLRYHMLLKGNYPKGRGIVPEHVVVPTAEDIIHHRDAVLEKTLRLIHGK